MCGKWDGFAHCGHIDLLSLFFIFIIIGLIYLLLLFWLDRK